MRYLVVSDRFFGDVPGGAQRIAWELARLMRDAGHDVTLFCGATSGGSTGAAVEDVESIRVARYEIPAGRRWSPLRWRAHVRAAREQASRLLGGGAAWDVIHGHGVASMSGVLAAAVPARRVVYTVHSPVVLEQRLNWADGTITGFVKRQLGLGVLRRAEAAILDAAESVHVLSRYTAAELARCHGPWVSAKAVEIPWWGTPARQHTTRAAARAALGIPASAPVFFTLRRLVRRMGLDVLLAAMAQLREVPETVLLLAGDGPQRAQLEAQARAAGVADRVRFLGRVSEDEIDLAYAACDAFVLPTRALECFGIIAVDALARGRPVIGTDVGAIPEILRPLGDEWVVAPGDPAALASAMRAFLRRAPPRADEAAIVQYAAERFGRERLAERYAELLSRGPGPATGNRR